MKNCANICGSTNTTANLKGLKALPSVASVRATAERIVLNGDHIRPRYALDPGHLKTAGFIASELSTSFKYAQVMPFSEKLKVSSNSAKVSDERDARQYDFANVYASQEAASAGLLFVAHYDAIALGEKAWDYLNPVSSQGADDNASGLTVLFEMGKELSRHIDAMKRGAGFLVTDAEETCKLGVKRFLRDERRGLLCGISGAVVFDCVGFNPLLAPGIEIVANEKGRDIAEAILRTNRMFYDPLDINLIVDDANITDTEHDDFSKAGIPSVLIREPERAMIWEGVLNRTIHTTKDTLDILNFEQISKLIRLMNVFSVHFLSEY